MPKQADSGSRWFRVTAERFDWWFKPRCSKLYRKGDVAYGSKACIDAGLAAGAIEIIPAPKGAKVGKDGQVTYGN